jgi:hypothetical protein
MPEFAAQCEDELHKWFMPELAEHMREGIRKARGDSGSGP